MADEAGLPALLAILESLPPGHRAIAIAEVAGDTEIQAVRCDAFYELYWASRKGRPPGTTSVLLETLRALELPRGRGQAWGGAEALAMRDVRQHLQAHHPGLAGSLALLGYWKHGTTPDNVD